MAAGHPPSQPVTAPRCTHETPNVFTMHLAEATEMVDRGDGLEEVTIYRVTVALDLLRTYNSPETILIKLAQAPLTRVTRKGVCSYTSIITMHATWASSYDRNEQGTASPQWNCLDQGGIRINRSSRLRQGSQRGGRSTASTRKAGVYVSNVFRPPSRPLSNHDAIGLPPGSTPKVSLLVLSSSHGRVHAFLQSTSKQVSDDWKTVE